MKAFSPCAALCAALLLAAAPVAAADAAADDGADQARFNQRLRGLWSGGGGSVFGGESEGRPGTDVPGWLDSPASGGDASAETWNQARKRAEEGRPEGRIAGGIPARTARERGIPGK